MVGILNSKSPHRYRRKRFLKEKCKIVEEHHDCGHGGGVREISHRIPNDEVGGGKKQMRQQPARSNGFKGRVPNAASNKIGNDAAVSVNCNSRTGTTNKLKLNRPRINNGKKNKKMKKPINDFPSKTTRVFIKRGSNIIYHPSNHVNTTTACHHSKSEEKIEEGRVNSNHTSSNTKKRGTDFSSTSVIEAKQQNWCSSSNKEVKRVKNVGVKNTKKGFTYDIICMESKRRRQNLTEEASDELSCNSTFRAQVVALKEVNNGELGLSSDVLTPRLALKDRRGNREPLPSDYSPCKRKGLVIDALERGDVCDALRVAISQKTGLVDLPDTELVKKIKVIRKDWCKNLNIGDKVENRFKDGKWYQTQIIEGNGRSGRVKLHFIRWSSKYDKWVKLQVPYRNFVPMHTFTRYSRTL